MSFKEDIQELVTIRDRLANSKLEIDAIVALIRVRAVSEQEGARKIEAVASQVSLPSESCISSSISGLHASFTKRNEQSRQFHTDVIEEVISPLFSLISRLTSVHVSAEKDAQSLVDNLESMYRNHDEALFQYKKYINEMNVLLQHQPIPRAQIGRIAWESKKAEKLYHLSLQNLNKGRLKFFDFSKLILHQLYDIYRERTEGVREAIEKYLVFELALNRNTQYDTEKSFLNIHFEICKVPPVDHFEKINIWEPEQIMIVPIVQSVELKLIDLIWSPSDEFISNDIIEAMKEPFSISKNCVSFCEAISLQFNEIRSDKQFHLLGKLLWLILDLNDSESACRVATFAQKFYYIDEKKKFIQAEIYHHKIWNRVVFWQSALLICVTDELCQLPSLMSIDTFGNHILVFGISPESAKNIAKQVIQEYFTNDSELEERILKSIHIAEQRQLKHRLQQVEQDS